ncbi:nucleoid-associated protein YejK [Gallaecimonas kandeliae]|uniref:nucleoid-associated protein YejK n=1 Tax=Gallaecimonas kandeliae TaxID=3029055 RepID=UPI0026492B5C|nr:nucleoid-associated protein YejK [Gallaecimonas kandeliae]WKE67298.1 nucleoid-associated protein YejK [Gallaecimonas kandeliae]
MSIDVKALILHRLELNQEGLLAVSPRQHSLPATEAVAKLVAELHASYASKPGKGFAAFKDEGSPFAEALAGYLDGQSDFVPFTLTAADLLQAQLNHYGLLETGYLLLAHYKHLAVDKLLVLQLKAQESVTITDALELGQTRFLELKSLQLAASVDLTAWQVEPERRQYISFVRGRAGRKVSDFFLDFLGCEEGVDAKAQSKALLTAVDDYCAAVGLEGEERQELGKQVFGYCKEKASTGEDVSVAELSDSLPPWEGESRFADFAVQGDYGLEDRFPVEQSALKALVKFSGTGAGVTLSFEEKHLGSRVLYDMATDTLTIKGIPANLREQLKKRLSND